MIKMPEEEEPQKAEEPITEYGRLDQGGIYTYWDYLKWEFTERVELIKGKIFKMGAPNVGHQRISGNVFVALHAQFHGKSCEVFAAPFDVRLPVPKAGKDTTVVQPDLCIICDPQKLQNARSCDGAPDLVMEILSPGNTTHETRTKFKLYRDSGVREYWIIEPSKRAVSVYALQSGEYVGLQPSADGTVVQSRLFPDLRMGLSEIFYRI